MGAQGVEEAAAALRRGELVDGEGLCPDAVVMAAAQAPRASAVVFGALVSESAGMASCTVRARALGKRTSVPTMERVRMLLPQCTVMGVIDVLLALAAHAVLESLRAALGRPARTWRSRPGSWCSMRSQVTGRSRAG